MSLTRMGLRRFRHIIYYSPVHLCDSTVLLPYVEIQKIREKRNTAVHTFTS